MVCTFSTSQLPKVVWERCALYIWTWKLASRHNSVQFSSLIWPHGSAPAALASLLVDAPEPQIIGKKVNRDFSIFSRLCIFFFLTFSLLWSPHFFTSPLWLFPPLLFRLPILLEVWLPKLPSIMSFLFAVICLFGLGNMPSTLCFACLSMRIACIGLTSTRTSSCTGSRRSLKPSGRSCPQNRSVRKLSTRLTWTWRTQWVLPWRGWSLPRMLGLLALKENNWCFRLVAFCVFCSPSISLAKIHLLTNFGLRMPLPKSPVVFPPVTMFAWQDFRPLPILQDLLMEKPCFLQCSRMNDRVRSSLNIWMVCRKGRSKCWTLDCHLLSDLMVSSKSNSVPQTWHKFQRPCDVIP